MKINFFLLCLFLFLLSASCIKVKHEMTIQPIHVTIEIKVKIDKELENFFGDIDKAAAEEKKETEEEKKEGKDES
ncbi:MAG: hypothetical protein KAT34_08670 [Candidatus Aminicenantes bacterium]|nr:hypothetical protein [Candidatus Aminicenantes bacterium]